MPRLPIKKTRKLAKAEAEGQLKAQTEHEYKEVKWLADIIPFLPEKYKKNAALWLKRMVEKNISKLPKAIAIIGLTVVIKHLMDTIPELIETVSALHKIPWFYKVASPLLYQAEMFTITVEKIDVTKGLPEWFDWVIAFSLAYIIVEHGGQIALGLGESVKGLSGIVGFLLA